MKTLLLSCIWFGRKRVNALRLKRRMLKMRTQPERRSKPSEISKFHFGYIILQCILIHRSLVLVDSQVNNLMNSTWYELLVEEIVCSSSLSEDLEFQFTLQILENSSTPLIFSRLLCNWTRCIFWKFYPHFAVSNGIPFSWLPARKIFQNVDYVLSLFFLKVFRCKLCNCEVPMKYERRWNRKEVPFWYFYDYSS